MKRVFALLATPMAILALLVPIALTQEPSPAGGRYFELNGKDNYAILEAGKLVDTKFEDFTVEAWIYLRSSPEIQKRWIIAAKPGTFELSMIGPEVVSGGFGYSFKVYTANPNRPLDTATGETSFRPLTDEFFNLWCHISGSFDGSSHLARVSFNGLLINSGGFPFRDLVNTDSPLYIGGMKSENSYFDGFIDEVRFSNIVRYKDSFKPPKGPFKADENTVALWHFDEGKGNFRFKDSSGNGNTLIGKGSGFSVEPTGKLSTRWANIKSFELVMRPSP